MFLYLLRYIEWFVYLFELVNRWGVLSDERDVTIHEGEIADGQLSGLGTYYFENGDTYTGGWKEGLFHGEGTYIYAQGGW